MKKRIEEMTCDEMRKEIQEYINNNYDNDENYVFISYSHRDEEQVYRTILPWMREGYNIYLDLDFKNRASDDNWVEIMKRKLRNNPCVMAIVFRSENYYFSLPSFVELLTMRSDKTRESRRSAKNDILPIDVIRISDPVSAGKEFSTKELKKKYQENFKKSTNETKTFLERNEKEKQILEEGLSTLDKKLHESSERSKEEDTKEKLYQELKEGYESDSFMNYYPSIARMVGLFFVANDLNGNYKALHDDERLRFKELQVYKELAQEEPVVPLTDCKEGEDKVPKEKAPEVKASEVKASEEESEEPKSGKRRSVTGDITYTIYGKSYTDNQTDMMVNVFAKVLKKHEDMLPAIIDMSGMNCLSATDYTLKENRGENMPTYFRTGAYLPIGGGVSVGTSYSVEDKVKKIATLLRHCGETLDTFVPQDEYVRGLLEKNYTSERQGASQRGRGTEETYTIYGEERTGNQSQMMIDALKALMEHHFDKREELATLLSVKLADREMLKDITYFNAGETFTYQGVTYSIGTAFGRPAKLVQIKKALLICGESARNFRIEGLELDEAENAREIGSGKKASKRDFLND